MYEQGRGDGAALAFFGERDQHVDNQALLL